MESVSDRLAFFLKQKGKGQTAFEKEAGLGRGYVKNASDNMGSKVMSKIKKQYPDININWLLTGEGQMLTEESEESKGSVVMDKKPKGAIPFYGDLPVSAGKQELATVLANMEPTGWISLPRFPESIGVFPVIGCSMEPEIRPGDFISITLIDRWEIVDPDKIYMIITNEDRMIKHLAIDEEHEDILWCISPNYPKFKIYKSDIIAIYRVTFYGKFV